MLIDTHAHINMDCYKEDFAQILNRAKENGVEKIIIPAVEPNDFETIVQLVNELDNTYCLLGVHPSEAQNFSHQTLDKIEELSKQNKKVVGIGEIGLDYYWEKDSAQLQKEIFQSQIELAKKLNLPIAIHDRDAHKDTLDILKSANVGELPIIMHCYSGSWEFTKELFKMNCYIALGGVVTFKNALCAKEVAKNIPLEKLLLETDCPYLTPVPHRGKQNEPSYIKYTAEEIAKLKGCDFDEVAHITSQNAIKVFNLD